MRIEQEQDQSGYSFGYVVKDNAGNIIGRVMSVDIRREGQGRPIRSMNGTFYDYYHSGYMVMNMSIEFNSSITPHTFFEPMSAQAAYVPTPVLATREVEQMVAEYRRLNAPNET